MGYRLSEEQMNQILQKLAQDYHIYAPARGKRGQDVRYREIHEIGEIVTDRQSDFSPKEVYYPVSQTMFYFTDSEVSDSTLKDDKGILLFARSCDIHAMKRLDKIFMENGGHADFFYARMREKVKVILMECQESFEHCFCVSMETSQTQDYDAAVRLGKQEVLAEVKDACLKKVFSGMEVCDFTPEFVKENAKKLQLPEITAREQLKEISNLSYWNQFDEKCIGCGGCNTVCGSCSCFDTQDVIYQEGSRSGERRRIWSSCMLNSFTETAGGGRARKTAGANMRFKVLHKFYDFRARFGGEDHMCVGCGRCDARCPQKISFFDTVSGLSVQLSKNGEEAQKDGE